MQVYRRIAATAGAVPPAYVLLAAAVLLAGTACSDSKSSQTPPKPPPCITSADCLVDFECDPNLGVCVPKPVTDVDDIDTDDLPDLDPDTDDGEPDVVTDGDEVEPPTDQDDTVTDGPGEQDDTPPPGDEDDQSDPQETADPDISDPDEGAQGTTCDRDAQCPNFRNGQRCNPSRRQCEWCDPVCSATQACNWNGAEWYCGTPCNPACGSGQVCSLGQCVTPSCTTCQRCFNCDASTGFVCKPIPNCQNGDGEVSRACLPPNSPCEYTSACCSGICLLGYCM